MLRKESNGYLIYLKYFKTSYIQDTNERGTLSLASIQRLVDTLHNPLEHSFVNSLGDRLNGELDLFFVLSFGDKIAAHLKLGLQQGARKVQHIQAKQVTDFLGHYAFWKFDKLV